MIMSRYATLSPEDFSRKAWELYREACPSESDIQTFQRAMSIARFRRGEVEIA